ncbi:polysaccharide lyase family 14 protein [Pluteus cervinus]|uniref:Polysaccharide lyase family 14 protein n=1 Tax=Pluteus cervinus TaxID=181527 RepID=A0ACD3BCV0_9AGAR|nr:polysaccharide lyase family 14 protein [Pluteus cervinus]
MVAAATLLFSLCTTLSRLNLVSAAIQLSAQQLAAQYSLTTSTAFPFPTATQSTGDTQSLITSKWSLAKGRIQDGPNNLDFVSDPFPNAPPPTGIPSNNSTGPVLRVTYPSGSFSHDTGGAQLINLWNTSDGTSFGSMIISYEVAFDSGFNWVKGGKLPGLRGGLDTTGCSGGSQANGQTCFSSRVMWRKSGDGEVYAYIPTPNHLCTDSNIICNPDFGTSISRNSFGFESARWNRITMLVQMNDPPNVANGNVRLFFNDIQALSTGDLQFRSASSLSINGMYFSTFFGGDDPSWATPQTTHTYFRNLQLWAGSAPSNLTGSLVKSAASSQTLGYGGLSGIAAFTLFTVYLL